jgi:hypothetical protein
LKSPQPHSKGPGSSDCTCLARPGDAAPIAFVLRYEDRWFGLEKRVAFAAPDVAAALAMMELEPIGRWAELSRDGELICRRGGEPGGAADYWVAD